MRLKAKRGPVYRGGLIQRVPPPPQRTLYQDVLDDQRALIYRNDVPHAGKDVVHRQFPKKGTSERLEFMRRIGELREQGLTWLQISIELDFSMSALQAAYKRFLEGER